MASTIKHLISPGIGFDPGKVAFIVTRGMSPPPPANAAYFVRTVRVVDELRDYRVALNNFNASAAPGATDDAADGYAPGSLWVDRTAGKAYICTDASVWAAVWALISP